VSALEFEFQEMLNEIDAISHLAAPFIDAKSRTVLPQLATSLENIRDAATNAVREWGISETFPLLTAVSHGGYQPEEQGEYNVFAEITSLWEVQRVRPAGKKTVKAKTFTLAGKASTRTRLFAIKPEPEQRSELAMWRAEAGDANSPGCHFHIQVRGETERPPFPQQLDIPRLPSLLLTPLAVFEFVLAELFQDRWLENITRQSAHLNRWAPIQRGRLTALLAWQLNVVKNASGSPWTFLKRAKPHTSLFSAAPFGLEVER
jgi:hypothetical protein